ncbi:hypothetical protein E4U61_005622 [Claviceps capensis]|nr:hypothetical protein E4U61_005622 [Claviceps capensis]
MREAAPTANGAIQSMASEVRNGLEFLSDIVNRVQKQCSDPVCLRRRKGQNPEDDSKYRRFHFPRDIIGTAELSTRRNPRYPMFCAKSNDTAMNHYSPLAIMACRANMDITPCTSVRVAFDYIAKYCTKTEVPKAPYTAIVKSVLPHVSDSRPVVSLAAKSFNKLLIENMVVSADISTPAQSLSFERLPPTLSILLVERDWGSQEVTFLLLNLPLVEGSRVVLTLDCRAEQDRDAVVGAPDIDGDRQSTRPGRSLYVKYIERDEEYEATTLFTFLTRHNTNRPQLQRLAGWVPDRILRHVPRYRSDPEHISYSDYCRLKVVLHVLFYGEGAFHYLRDRDPRQLQFNYIDDIPTHEEEVDQFEAADLEDEKLLDAGLGGADHRNPDDLASRPLDLSANWDAFAGNFSEELPDLLLPTAKDEHWKSLKASTSINLDYGTEASNAEASLNPEQRLLFETIVEHYGRALDGLARIRSGPTSPVARIAPTGAAAKGIHGYTDHAYFGLPVQRFETLSSLGPDGVSAIRKRLEGVSYLIVD